MFSPGRRKEAPSHQVIGRVNRSDIILGEKTGMEGGKISPPP